MNSDQMEPTSSIDKESSVPFCRHWQRILFGSFNDFVLTIQEKWIFMTSHFCKNEIIKLVIIEYHRQWHHSQKWIIFWCINNGIDLIALIFALTRTSKSTSSMNLKWILCLVIVRFYLPFILTEVSFIPNESVYVDPNVFIRVCSRVS